jgi:hypothetical protein
MVKESNKMGIKEPNCYIGYTDGWEIQQNQKRSAVPYSRPQFLILSGLPDPQ